MLWLGKIRWHLGLLLLLLPLTGDLPEGTDDECLSKGTELGGGPILVQYLHCDTSQII